MHLFSEPVLYITIIVIMKKESQLHCTQDIAIVYDKK
jgi:hypothetical protein